MTYREINYDIDVPEVVALLKTSLSDHHTAAHFLWKHTKNPFGKSFGILACDEGKIIAVRMFMRWEFIQNGKILKAARPVDTVTHKDYRHKGIFSALTENAVVWANRNTALIFNTPNKNSAPGNLKMGWKKLEKPPYFKMAFLSSYPVSGEIKTISLNAYGYNVDHSGNGILNSHYSNEFIKWRYSDKIYTVAVYRSGKEKVFVIYRTSAVRNLKMIILYEILGNSDYHNEALRALQKKTRTYLFYFLGSGSVNINTTFVIKRSSPLVLYRDDKNGIINNINFSLGDLEGRI